MHKIIDITSGKRHGGLIKVTLDTSAPYPKATLDAVFEDGLQHHGHESATIFVNGSTPTRLSGGSIERRHNDHLSIIGGYSTGLTSKAYEYLKSVLAPVLDELYAADPREAYLKEVAGLLQNAEEARDKAAEHARKMQGAVGRLEELSRALRAGEEIPKVTALSLYGPAEKGGGTNFHRLVPYGVAVWVKGRFIGATGFMPYTLGGFEATVQGQAAYQWVRDNRYSWDAGEIELSGLED